MKLSALLENTEILELVGSGSVDVTSLGFDSREAAPGGVFFAIRGTASDGHAYIAAAIERGASVVVCEHIPTELRAETSDAEKRAETSVKSAARATETATPRAVTFVRVADSSVAMGDMAAAFYGHPSRALKIVGVTGTNGKTTIATLLYDTFRALGYKAGLISTVSYRIDEREIPSTHTTPDAIRLQGMMAEMVAGGCAYCFMEVSSHSVVQERIRGLQFAGGIFTNLTHDHLDYHGTFAAYIKAKKAFFDALPRGAFALVNTDDRNGEVMVQNTAATVRTYAMRGFADYKCRILESSPEGTLIELDGEQLWVMFWGRFNAYNLAAVYGAARELGAGKQETLRVLSTLTPVRGRFETVRSRGGITAVVDYAHTPDALRNVLDTIAEMLSGGRLIVVVGCGGDRDRTKRPVMARIACESADVAIFTADNPRHERAEDIIAEMTAGVAGSSRRIVITDRAEAIRAAAVMASPGDVILIAGKGHETYQIVGDERRHFDDREEIMKCFEGK